MAMFEFKNSEDIKVTKSTTTAEVLISGDGLKRVEVDACHAGIPSPALPPSSDTSGFRTKIWLWVLENSIKAIFSALGAVMAAAALIYWNLKK